MRFKWPQNSEVLWWAVICLLFALLLVIRVVSQGVLFVDGLPTETFAKAVGAGVLGAALWFEQAWAKWLGTLFAAALLGITCWQWSEGGFSWISAAGMALMGLACWQLWSLPLGEQEAEPFLSLVLLVREPRYLDHVILAQLAARAWRLPVEATSQDDEEMRNDRAYMFGESPTFACKHPRAFLLIHNSPEPYFEKPEEVADDIRELRAKQAVLDHQAWISVDIVSWLDEEEDLEEAYRVIARLLAELADEDCLAVIDADGDQLFVYDPETEVKLKGDNPHAELRKPYYSPIVGISEDDPRLQKAVREARERFPEFVTAYEGRHQHDFESSFLIKAPFRHQDETEFMWVEVQAIENDIVYGLLGNDPAKIPHLSEGDQVKVDVAELNDWMYVADGDPVGGFTLRALRDQM